MRAARQATSRAQVLVSNPNVCLGGRIVAVVRQRRWRSRWLRSWWWWWSKAGTRPTPRGGRHRGAAGGTGGRGGGGAGQRGLGGRGSFWGWGSMPS